MVNVIIASQFHALIEEQMITKTARAVLDSLSDKDRPELTIVLDDDAVIQDLNRMYLGIDSPTDVLSFEANELDPDNGNIYIGDVIISVQRAEAQSKSAGHPLQSEILLLVIHGTLHLLGYDHHLPEDKIIMWKIQQRLLDVLGIEIKRLPEV